MKTTRMLSCLVLALGFSTTNSFAHNANSAARVAQVSAKAAALAQRIIGSRGGQSSGGGGQTGGMSGSIGGSTGGFNPSPSTGGINLPWRNENDDLALPSYLQSTQHLNFAANAAFESQAAYLGGNIQLGNFRFTVACSRMSLGKLALARANLAALQFPVGFFGVFGQEVMASLNEIELTRTSVGCL